ncbi:ABC transporter permease [Fodinibius halophilus]|uniref:ABC transporter permease n=1 Tax=Fodinibius halophilus TaxID=1736908 RepID=A0A6M1TE80_9BACT|nr:FtsX-like permease family protein [Fodinibius halophilus]NGP86990.1 ABC transporter permease [Fodinibius halophilus]
MFKFFRLAVKNVFRNKWRTAFTISTVSIGFVAIIVAAGYMDYVFEGLRESFIRGGTGHIQVFNNRYMDNEEEYLLEYGITDYQPLVKRINDHSNVRFVMKRIAFQGLISNGEQTKVFLGKGIEPRKESRLSTFFVRMEEGYFPGIFKEQEGEMQGAIGQGLAESLNAKVGDYLTLLSTTPDGIQNAIDIKLTGVFTTGIPEYDNRQVMVNISTAQLLLHTDKISNLVVVLEETTQTDQSIGSLQQQNAGFSFVPWYDLTPYYKSVVALYKRGFGVLGVIMVFVVLLASSNTMTMSVFERTKEIGTNLSIGTPRYRIWLNHIYEGFLIGLLASLIGTLLSYMVIYLVNGLDITMPPPPGRTMAYPLSITAVHSTIAIVSFITVAVCMLASVWPAYRASNLSIVDALGYR